MALDNPAFSRNDAFTKQKPTPSAADLQALYDQPSAAPQGTREVMTIETTIGKSVLAFGLLLVLAAAGFLVPIWPVVIVAGIAGFVLALVNSFKKEPSKALILAYTACQGYVVGAISAIYEQQWNGIVGQAVLATLVVVGVTLALFASGKIRASKRATKIFLIAMIGYGVFSLINFGLMVFGVNDDPWGLRGADFLGTGIPFGLILGVFVVILGAYSLVLDFDFIQQGVRNRADRKYEWTGVFGIMVTVIWLYLEILRMIAIARD
ncbi:Bax inhibitor-1/YccA family membrane protein [Agromyces seonyuensis]|uniref:Bax inhibitor-1/YccA family protein n=1 Tax=Agromyces seonyuensis TaxID=2662446 RepID=A0A6I4NX92_9MICO|nr:Bax inhibitor-1/YccA family protein [Agromyces seonyuensis]MWB98920.1 hypothetical protein [Agromyces seonyuensis]